MPIVRNAAPNQDGFTAAVVGRRVARSPMVSLMDDWFWIGVIWSQRAMLLWCVYMLRQNGRYFDRMNRGMGEAADLIKEQESYIGRLIAERDALRTSLRLHQEEH